MSSTCWVYSMPTLEYFVILWTNIIFRIALRSKKNIKGHQKVWKNLSAEILWKFQTAAWSRSFSPYKTLPGCRAFTCRQYLKSLELRSWKKCKSHDVVCWFFFSRHHLKAHYLYLLIFRNANHFIHKLKTKWSECKRQPVQKN